MYYIYCWLVAPRLHPIVAAVVLSVRQMFLHVIIFVLSHFLTSVFFSEVIEVFQELSVGLDTVDLPGLQAAPTKPRQVATSAVLLA